MSRSATARVAPQDASKFESAVAMSAAVDKATVAIMMIDRDFEITYVNQATKDLLYAHAEQFQRAYPSLDMSRLVGASIDVFHKNPNHQRRMLSQPSETAHKAEITIGDLRFSLSISSIIDGQGEYIGNILEWENVTERREAAGRLAAIDKSQAAIQFTLDGIVVDANQNFLDALGYTLDEIKGKHHSLFVDPAYRQSAEYAAFWSKLSRGEFDAGEYKRIAKDGRAVWIQASYNPILDTNGRPMSVVKYATDITAVKLQSADFQGQIAAISKSQAVIEFGLDGVIHNANENFLAAMGYSLSEIQGQHHGIFVDPAYRQSHEYKAFWEKLSRGEYDAGEYKRVAKGGSEIWILASYNPILDMDGKPMKVVKYATDITAEKMRNADFQGQIDAIAKSQAVIEFDLDGRIVEANENFLATVGYSLPEIRGQHHSMFVDPAYRDSSDYRAFWDKLRRGEYDAGKYQRVGKGGREIWLQASYNPILDLNGKPFKVVKYATDITEVAEQRKAAMKVKEVAEIVSSAATEMRATAESMAKTAQDASLQATSVTNAAQLASTNVQTVSAAGEELSASIAEIARQVAESTNITQQAVAETDRTSAAIQSLADAAQKIGNVVTLINNIAGQTKLLALNATIEAARAGDAGKGFAVVASEVKSLSDQTAKATHEISSEVSAMQAATATSVTAINGIAETIGKVAEIASAIASAVEEQSAATGEISANVVQAAESTREVTTNIERLSEGVAQTGQAAGELLIASDELAGQAETLTAQVDTLLQ